MDQYPQHDKIKTLQGKNNVVGDFIDWLGEHGLVIAKYEGEEGYEKLWPVQRSTQDLIADYFEVDRNELEREKQAMLAAFRQQQQA